MAGAPHERWGSQLEYLLSCLGYAVGIGNIWRFPYLCYRNGGGAFLIPYFLTMFICGIPLVYLETTLGQFASAGCISVFNINPLFKGAGYAVVILNIISVIYFASIMSYPILYIYHSFSSPLPWQSCGNYWNTDKCTEITGNSSFFNSNGTITTPEDEFFHRRLLHMSEGIHEIGSIVWPVFYCNVICWILVYLCICNGVKSVGKIVYFTVLFPYFVLAILFVRGVTLPGAWEGIKFYILPDWGQLKNTKFVTIEAVIAGVLDEFPSMRRRKRWVTLCTCLVLFALSIICNTEGGLHVLGLLDSHVAIACVPVVCLLEIIAAVYTYGAHKLSADVLFMTGQPLQRFWIVLWRYIIPVILVIITIYALREASGIAGWSVALVSVICIPIHAGFVLYQKRGSFFERVRESCYPNDEWGPDDPEIRQRWKETKRHHKTVPLVENVKIS